MNDRKNTQNIALLTNPLTRLRDNGLSAKTWNFDHFENVEKRCFGLVATLRVHSTSHSGQLYKLLFVPNTGRGRRYETGIIILFP